MSIAFSGAKESDEDFLARIKRNNLAGLHRGVAAGWWEDVCEKAMLPIRVFRRSDFHETALIAHAFVRLGRYASVKEAKRAGWAAPLEAGTYRSGTWMMRIEA